MNPFATLDDSEREQAQRYSELLACERFWYYKAADAMYDGKLALYRMFCNRAQFYYELRVELVVY